MTIMNVHFPDGDKPASVKNAFLQRFEQAIKDTPSDDVLTIMGDCNACTGNNATLQDGVCGNHGNDYLNEAGRILRGVAAEHELRDLVTWEHQDHA